MHSKKRTAVAIVLIITAIVGAILWDTGADVGSPDPTTVSGGPERPLVVVSISDYLTGKKLAKGAELVNKTEPVIICHEDLCAAADQGLIAVGDTARQASSRLAQGLKDQSSDAE